MKRSEIGICPHCPIGPEALSEQSSPRQKTARPAQLSPTGQPTEDGNRRVGLAWGRYLRLIIAFILFLIGLIFNRWLQATPYASGEYLVLLTAYLLVGWPVLSAAGRSIAQGRIFNELSLMSIATIGAILLHQLPEAVAVMLFYSVGEALQDRAVDKSIHSIKALLALRPESARLIVDGQRQLVQPEAVQPGDELEVLPGERIPLDGTVIEGESYVDTSSLTGESQPRRVSAGSTVLGGFVNDEGRLIVKASKEFGQSLAARILDLVSQAAARKAPTERLITRLAAVYTPVVVGLAAAVALFPPLLIAGATFRDWFYRALVILVISCPCALVVSIPLGYFGGIGGAARRKLLVKGSNYLDALAKVDTVVFDKTGTLTEGVFTVTEIVTRNGFTKQEILNWAAAAEAASSHPIAKSIREAAGQVSTVVDDYQEIKGHGVIAKLDGKRLVVGNDRLLHREKISHQDCEAEGTIVYLAVDKQYAGYLVVSDRIKTAAAATVKQLRALGVRRLVMLSGDDQTVTAQTAAKLGLDDYYGELLPDGKAALIEQLKQSTAGRGSLIFVGDGMNDAPALVSADVGVAMGALGSEAAIEAADLVVMDDDISRLPTALQIARSTRRIIFQNIGFALAAKLIFISLGAFGLAGMWEAVIADVGVSLVAILNALRPTAGYYRPEAL